MIWPQLIDLLIKCVSVVKKEGVRPPKSKGALKEVRVLVRGPALPRDGPQEFYTNRTLFSLGFPMCESDLKFFWTLLPPPSAVGPNIGAHCPPSPFAKQTPIAGPGRRPLTTSFPLFYYYYRQPRPHQVIISLPFFIFFYLFYFIFLTKYFKFATSALRQL